MSVTIGKCAKLLQLSYRFLLKSLFKVKLLKLPVQGYFPTDMLNKPQTYYPLCLFLVAVFQTFTHPHPFPSPPPHYRPAHLLLLKVFIICFQTSFLLLLPYFPLTYFRIFHVFLGHIMESLTLFYVAN